MLYFVHVAVAIDARLHPGGQRSACLPDARVPPQSSGLVLISASSNPEAISAPRRRRADWSRSSSPTSRPLRPRRRQGIALRALAKSGLGSRLLGDVAHEGDIWLSLLRTSRASKRRPPQRQIQAVLDDDGLDCPRGADRLGERRPRTVGAGRVAGCRAMFFPGTAQANGAVGRDRARVVDKDAVGRLQEHEVRDGAQDGTIPRLCPTSARALHQQQRDQPSLQHQERAATKDLRIGTAPRRRPVA